MTFSIKSALTDITALALVGVVAFAPLTAEARGLDGHVPRGNNAIHLKGGTEFKFESKTPTLRDTNKARSKRSDVKVRRVNARQFTGPGTQVYVPLSTILRQLRGSADFFR